MCCKTFLCFFFKQAQHLIRAIILGAQVVGRAFTQAVKNEFQRN